MEVGEAEVQAEMEEVQAEAAASKISEDQRHFNSKALRCCLPMQTINTTGHTGRKAAREGKGSRRGKEGKEMVFSALLCSALAWPASACVACSPLGHGECAVPAVA